LHPLPAHLRRLSDSSYLSFGVLAFLLTLGIQYWLYHRLLQRQLLTHDVAQMRPAVSRWLKVVLLWQVVVVAASAGYVGAVASHHPPGIAWIAPAIAAVFGTAIPLQVAVVAILRASRGAS
jgi:hypothetical protein